MELDNYYEIVMSYNTVLVGRYENGQMDNEKFFRCCDKIGEWWKLAKERVESLL